MARFRAIVRDFDDDKLDEHVALLERVAQEVVASEPRARLEVTTRRQYRNMRRYLERVPEVIAAAEAAIVAEGLAAAAHAHPRRHRRVAAQRDGTADAQPVHRRS